MTLRDDLKPPYVIAATDYYHTPKGEQAIATPFKIVELATGKEIYSPPLVEETPSKILNFDVSPQLLQYTTTEYDIFFIGSLDAASREKLQEIANLLKRLEASPDEVLFQFSDVPARKVEILRGIGSNLFLRNVFGAAAMMRRELHEEERGELRDLLC